MILNNININRIIEKPNPSDNCSLFFYKLKKNGNLKENLLSANFVKKNNENKSNITCKFMYFSTPPCKTVLLIGKDLLSKTPINWVAGLDKEPDNANFLVIKRNFYKYAEEENNINKKSQKLSWTRFTALGGLDSQQCGIRIGLFKFHQSTSYGLCLKGKGTVLVRSRMCKASFPKFLSRGYCEEKKIEGGQLIEKEETEENQNKRTVVNILKVENLIINHNYTQITNNLVYDPKNTVLMEGKLLERNGQRIVRNEEGLEPSLHFSLDGAILEGKNFINSTDIRAYRNEVLFDPKNRRNLEKKKAYFTESQIEKGKRFYFALIELKEKITSIDLTWDLSFGLEYHNSFFSDITTCFKERAVFSKSKRFLYFIDLNKNQYVLKKRSKTLEAGNYLVKEDGKGRFKMVENKPFPKEAIADCRTFYLGQKHGPQSRLKIYSKPFKSPLEEHHAIIRIEITAKEKTDLDLVQAYLEKKITKEELTFKLFDKYFFNDLEFKNVSGKAKNKENASIAPFWSTFQKKLGKAIPNMEHIDPLVLKRVSKKVLEENTSTLLIEKKEKKVRK